MQIVIDIPEEMYKWVYDANKFYNDYGRSDFVDLIKNGIPLPKGNGRLGDLDALKHQFELDLEYAGDPIYPLHKGYRIGVAGCIQLIDNAPTIIEADKEREE